MAKQHWEYVTILIYKCGESQKPWLKANLRGWGCGALQPGIKRRFLILGTRTCKLPQPGERRNKRPWQRKIISSATCCQGEASRLGGV